jgi:hypothetical protein
MAGLKSLAQLLGDAFDARLTRLHTALPAEVVSYDPATQTAAVQPLIKEVLIDAEGETSAHTLPQISNVPVMFPRSGGWFCSFPIAKGDTVLLVFAEKSIGRWREQDKLTDPGVVSMHHLSDAMAIPGLFANPRKLPDVHAENMVIGHSGGAQIHIKPDGTVHLSQENATSPVALATPADAQIAALKSAVDAIMDLLIPYAGVSAPFVGASLTAVKATLASDIAANPLAAQNVKAT